MYRILKVASSIFRMIHPITQRFRY